MEWISEWAEGIIIAVIIGTIIEMIIPEGNSKKYIKVVIGVYVLFTIVSPIITKITGDTISVSDILDLDEYIKETEESINVQNSIQANNESSIMEIYSSSIKSDMIAKVEAKGYIVNSIDVEIANDDSYSITSVTMSVKKSNTEDEETNNTIEPVETVNKIEVSITENDVSEDESEENGSTLSYSEKEELKEYLSSVYEVDEGNIDIT